MFKLSFTNARVKDTGYGMEVNGKSLSDIISTMLGTKAGSNYGYKSVLPDFKSNCCNVTIIIDPQPVTTKIDTGEETWYSVEDMEEDRNGQYQQKVETSETEE